MSHKFLQLGQCTKAHVLVVFFKWKNYCRKRRGEFSVRSQASTIWKECLWKLNMCKLILLNINLWKVLPLENIWALSGTSIPWCSDHSSCTKPEVRLLLAAFIHPEPSLAISPPISIACVCNASNLELLWKTYSLPRLDLGEKVLVWCPQIRPNLPGCFHSTLAGISTHSGNHDSSISNLLVPSLRSI